MADNFDELFSAIPTISQTEAAQRLGVPPGRIQQFVKDSVLVGWKTRAGWVIAEEALVEKKDAPSNDPLAATHEPLRALRGTLLVLSDAGLSRQERIAWLWTENDLLEEQPIALLREGFHARVNQFASLLG